MPESKPANLATHFFASVLARSLYRLRWLIIAGLLALAAAMALWQIPNLAFDLSFGTLFEAEEGDRQALRDREGSFSGILPEFVVTGT